MKFSSKITKFQEGGPVPAEAPVEAGAPAPAPEEATPAQANPEQQLQQIAGQLLDMLMQQIGDPQVVAAVLQTALDMLAQAAQPQAPVMQRQGGRLVRVRR